MKITPIEDANTDFNLVVIYQNTPHCKHHGAMNKVNVFSTGAYWRCISTVSKTKENNCRAGCIQTY